MNAPRRKQLKRREIAGHARYLTFSCFQRQPLLESIEARDLFADQLFLVRTRLRFQLLAWVVMPEHVHLLVMPASPEMTIAQILGAIKRPSAAKLLPVLDDGRFDLIERSSGKRRLWQRGGGYDRNVHSREELDEKVNYIHENPCRRGLVAGPEDWAWSSARVYLGLPSRWPEIDRVVF